MLAAPAGQHKLIFILFKVTENVAVRHRYWMGIAFNYAYPLGMLYLALAAFLLKEWREVQLALTVPAASLLLFFL